jgi:hypothetical protein
VANELTVYDANQFAVVGNDSQETMQIIRDNLGNGGLSVFDLDRIKVPAGGSKTWTMQTVDGEVEVKSIDGIIIYFRDTRAYWPQSFADSGGGTSPDCASHDGLIGIGTPGGACARCPLAQFGSGGEGQACKQVRMLFVLREHDMLPVVVALPPTSIKPVRQYFMRLASANQPIYGVVTSLTLETTKSTGGINYSRVVPSRLASLSPEQLARVKSYVAEIKPNLDQVTANTEEYEN